jgi:hypothetical protein
VELQVLLNALTSISAKLQLVKMQQLNLEQLIPRLAVRDSKLYLQTILPEQTMRTKIAFRSNTIIGKECPLAQLMDLGLPKEQLRTVLLLRLTLLAQVQWLSTVQTLSLENLTSGLLFTEHLAPLVGTASKVKQLKYQQARISTMNGLPTLTPVITLCQLLMPILERSVLLVIIATRVALDPVPMSSETVILLQNMMLFTLVTFASQAGSAKLELELLQATERALITPNGVSNVPLDHMPLMPSMVFNLKTSAIPVHSVKFVLTMSMMMMLPPF